MNKLKSLILPMVVLSVALISGCSEKLDTSTDKEMKVSISEMLKQKSTEEVNAFQEGYDSIINYSYATVTNGNIPDIHKNYPLVLGAVLPENDKNKKKFESVASSVLSGMSYSDVVEAKQEYTDKTIKLVKEGRVKREEEAKKQAIIDAEEKEKKDKENAIIQAHIDAQRTADRKLELETVISKLETLLDDTEEKIAGYNIGLEPYDTAQAAYEKIKIQNLSYSKPDGKRLQMDFEITNDSNYTVKSFNINMNLIADDITVVRKFGGSDSKDSRIVPFGKKVINDRLYLTPINNVSTVDEIKTEVQLTALIEVEGEAYEVNEEGVSVSNIIRKNLQMANVEKVNLESQITKAKADLESFNKE